MRVNTLSLRAFSYLAKSLSDLKVELAASQTYLKSFWLIGSFQKASHVTVLSCRTSFHCCPGYGCSGTGSPAPIIHQHHNTNQFLCDMSLQTKSRNFQINLCQKVMGTGLLMLNLAVTAEVHMFCQSVAAEVHMFGLSLRSKLLMQHSFMGWEAQQ